MISVGQIVPVISGKGGVGKSTVAVNLAVALARTGAKVGLIDSDFYGPSIPTLLGGGQVIPDHEEKLIPPAKFGIKYISLGFFLRHPDDAVIWRGPMFNKALHQMFEDVSWGAIDYMIIDMPPGTGDAQLSLSQMVKLAGAVVVTTPQEVALADVRKSINMLKKVNVDVLGIVENMSGLPMPDGSVMPIFGSGGGERTAKEFGVPLLAQLPIDPAIREGGDAGTPIAAGEGDIASIFHGLAERVISILDAKKRAEPALKIVN
jgi:ATP-binding protein involved in chromosome partitioning